MKLDFVAENAVPDSSRINSFPSSFHVPTGKALDWVLSMCWDDLFLWLSLTKKMVGFGFADFPCFCSFSSWLWGSLARKKGGEKLDWGLNAYKEMPAHLVFVKMCTSAQRRSETGCFTLLWQDTQQAKWPKQIKPHAHFNQGLYSLSQVKSPTNVLAWVAVNLSFCKEQALRFSKAVLLISIKGLEKQRLEEGRGSLILGRGPRKTRCLGGGSIDTLGIEKVSNASCRAPQRMRVSDAFVSLYGKMIARGFTRLGKAAASFHITLTAELESAEPLFAGVESPSWLYSSPLHGPVCSLHIC